jgi:hypothetical protein
MILFFLSNNLITKKWGLKIQSYNKIYCHRKKKKNKFIFI